MATTTILYSLPAPYSTGDQVIEVYGDPENAHYEWRVRDSGGVGLDTGTEGIYGRSYGIPEIALRDALIVTSGLPDPHVEAMRRIEGQASQPLSKGANHESNH